MLFKHLGFAFIALCSASPALAHSGHQHNQGIESGGGVIFESGTALIDTSDGSYPGIGGIGGKGLRITDQVWRVGGEGMAYWGAMNSLEFGAFADYIVASPGPFHLYAGLGAGLGLGNVNTNSTTLSGGWLYVKPEIGIQMNMGRTALELELSYNLIPTAMSNPELGYPGHVGITLGILRGNFGHNRRRLGPSTPNRGPSRQPPPPRQSTRGQRSTTYQPPPPSNSGYQTPPPSNGTYQPPPPPRF